MTVASKEKRLANTGIEVSQHALVTFKFLTDFFAFYLISVGRGKLQKNLYTCLCLYTQQCHFARL